MNPIAGQIRRCMSDLRESADGELMARFLFPPEFIGFQGHFPGRPILPAVCEIQAAIAMLEASSRQRVRLGEIVSAKFSMPVSCDEEVVYSCSVAMQDPKMALLKASVAKHGRTVARFSLRVVFEEKA
jgi:3-hydroxyacyl-[acyl-carrier-protein] dehydratase